MIRDFNQLKDQHFDVVVCGGGIYGAWTAYDAALRGLKVALIDKGDWASGTSSASTKLIHGGLRYLETLDFKLVKKSLVEREMLFACAPHRVWPLRFGIPIFKNSRLGSFRLKLGLSLYDFLAGNVAAGRKHQYIHKAEFSRLFPPLQTSNLSAGFCYIDGQTDDARFVLELVDGAINAGAVCVNYCAVTNLLESAGKLIAVKVVDQVSGNSIEILTKQVIDTTGRWSQSLRHQLEDLRLSKGIHLIMPKTLGQDALFLTAKSDGRVFFMIPWYERTLLGTTDSDYRGDLEDIPINKDEIQYLLSEANHAFNLGWTERDIIGKFVGVRVLKPSNKENPTHASRDWLAVTDSNGLISSVGGKYTSAREDAACLVDMVCQRLGKTADCRTFGKSFPWLKDIDIASLLQTTKQQAKALGLTDIAADYLVKRHGTRSLAILQICGENPDLAVPIKADLPFILADLVFCAQQEMVVHLDDLLRRRLPLLILAKLTLNDIRHFADLAATRLNWDEKTTEMECQYCLESFADNILLH